MASTESMQPTDVMSALPTPTPDPPTVTSSLSILTSSLTTLSSSPSTSTPLESASTVLVTTATPSASPEAPEEATHDPDVTPVASGMFSWLVTFLNYLLLLLIPLAIPYRTVFDRIKLDFATRSRLLWVGRTNALPIVIFSGLFYSGIASLVLKIVHAMYSPFRIAAYVGLAVVLVVLFMAAYVKIGWVADHWPTIKETYRVDRIVGIARIFAPFGLLLNAIFYVFSFFRTVEWGCSMCIDAERKWCFSWCSFLVHLAVVFAIFGATSWTLMRFAQTPQSASIMTVVGFVTAVGVEIYDGRTTVSKLWIWCRLCGGVLACIGICVLFRRVTGQRPTRRNWAVYSGASPGWQDGARVTKEDLRADRDAIHASDSAWKELVRKTKEERTERARARERAAGERARQAAAEGGTWY